MKKLTSSLCCFLLALTCLFTGCEKQPADITQPLEKLETYCKDFGKTKADYKETLKKQGIEAEEVPEYYGLKIPVDVTVADLTFDNALLLSSAEDESLYGVFCSYTQQEEDKKQVTDLLDLLKGRYGKTSTEKGTSNHIIDYLNGTGNSGMPVYKDYWWLPGLGENVWLIFEVDDLVSEGRGVILKLTYQILEVPDI